jgi:hypothetical protein
VSPDALEVAHRGRRLPAIRGGLQAGHDAWPLTDRRPSAMSDERPGISEVPRKTLGDRSFGDSSDKLRLRVRICLPRVKGRRAVQRREPTLEIRVLASHL